MEISNPTRSKIASQLQLAGAEPTAAVLSGLAGRLRLRLDPGEALEDLRVTEPDTAFDRVLAWTPLTGVNGPGAYADLVFGTDTVSGDDPVRNYVDWTTSRGSGRRQLWCRDLPDSGCIYVNNQECQEGEATVYVDRDGDEWSRKASIALNILPELSDEQFRQFEYSGNRYANTRRAWGGASVADVWMGETQIFSNESIERIHSFNYEPEEYGLYVLTVRLKATSESLNYIDVTGNVRFRRFSS